MNETHLTDETTLNHRSGCGWDVTQLRKRFLTWLLNHDEPGKFLSTKEMCKDVSAWSQFSKRVVDPVLESMADVVELSDRDYAFNKGWPRKIRLKPEAIGSVRAELEGAPPFELRPRKPRWLPADHDTQLNAVSPHVPAPLPPPAKPVTTEQPRSMLKELRNYPGTWLKFKNLPPETTDVAFRDYLAQ